ncbi:hypothetical protein BMS3Abin16_01474 [archaeon BMS3Abin16]|nr:hypothetical protein BMS3Abin16_01474 [archaeon BMS3Abin16]GBE56661.1 hypothetical protein BMS3Bbin16_00870 [archaeon BMS3Bbin16]HDY73484.1 hypothetical protein [Euryarchaeota archaeon]
MENNTTGDRISQYFFIAISVMIGLLAVLSVLDFFSQLGPSSMNIEISHGLLDKILYSIILVELFHLTVTYALKAVMDPRELIVIILTAVGRELIVKDLFKESPVNTLAAAVVLLICIYALRILPTGHAIER